MVQAALFSGLGGVHPVARAMSMAVKRMVRTFVVYMVTGSPSMLPGSLTMFGGARYRNLMRGCPHV